MGSLLLFLAAFVPGDLPPEEKVRLDDGLKLQGTWYSEGFLSCGEKADQPLELTFNGNQLGWKASGALTYMPVKIDSRRKHIDIAALGDIQYGIYSLDGDTLRICIGEVRATTFECPLDSRRVLIVLKRTKP